MRQSLSIIATVSILGLGTLYGEPSTEKVLFTHPDSIPASSWSAKWIGVEAVSPPSGSFESAAETLADASWIGCDEVGIDPVKNAPAGVRNFRRTVELDSRNPISNAVAVMAADNHFTLSVNGKKVGSGDDWNKPVIAHQEGSQIAPP